MCSTSERRELQIYTQTHSHSLTSPHLGTAYTLGGACDRDTSHGSHIAAGLCCGYGAQGSAVTHLYRGAHDTSEIPQELHPLISLDCERGTATCVHASCVSGNLALITP